MLLPRFKNKDFHRTAQADSEATYFGKRTAADGVIDWQRSASQIIRLIKAASHPHPGAFSFYNDEKIIIWNAIEELTIKATGVPGSILLIDETGIVVQTGLGLVRITDYTAPLALRVGGRLGYYCQIEIFELKQELRKLKELTSSLDNR